MRRNNISSEEWPILGHVQPLRTADISQLSLLVYRKQVFHTVNNFLQQEFVAVPLTTLIGHLRQFEACIRGVNVPFLSRLLGSKEPTHLRFNDDSDDDEEDNEDEKEKDKCFEEKNQMICEPCNDEVTGFSLLFQIPELNATQERAVMNFINSPSSTLSLVQGPPGTGKTTFLVALLCRCILDGLKRGAGKRFLVTTPTNRALVVLVSRFLEALNSDDSHLNIVLIGVQDKLMPEDEGGGFTYDDACPSNPDDPLLLEKITSTSLSAKDIFVYTWLQSIIQKYQMLLLDLKSWEKKLHNSQNILQRAKKLHKRLVCGIPDCFDKSGSKAASESFNAAVEEAITRITSKQILSYKESKSLWDNASLSLSTLISSLMQIETFEANQEVLATADIIFCTLSSAGVSLLKQTKKIDDFFVDEAAAATEAEICIPFHLQPSRMLAVGDPLQLPAMVFSRHAADMGLSKSLHARLMYDCSHSYIMLDVQYRMKPDICQFPSLHFYQGKIGNGPNVLQTNSGPESFLLQGKPYSFIQVNGMERQTRACSFVNAKEAHIVVDLIKRLRDENANCFSIPHTVNDSWSSPEKVRVITFYQGQVSLIKNLLKQSNIFGVLVTTVDSSQGSEADIIILSFVRSNNVRSSISAGFLVDDRRLNVALTRAKFQLICVGNATGTLSSVTKGSLKHMVQNAVERGLVINW